MPNHQSGRKTKGAKDLTSAQKAAVLAQRDLGIEYKQIAKKTGVSEEAARKLVSRSKKRANSSDELPELIADASIQRKKEYSGRKALIEPGSEVYSLTTVSSLLTYLL